MKLLISLLLLLVVSCGTLEKYVDTTVDTVIVGAGATLGASIAGPPGAFAGASITYLVVDNVDKVEFIEKHTVNTEPIYIDPTANMFWTKFKWFIIAGMMIFLFTNPYKVIKIPVYIFKGIKGLASRASILSKISSKDSP